MLLGSDTAVGITKSTVLAMIGFAVALIELQPDLRVVIDSYRAVFTANHGIDPNICL